MTILSSVIDVLTALLTPVTVLAQTINSTVTNVGGLLPGGVTTVMGCSGSNCGFVNIVGGFVTSARPLVFIAAVFLISLSGFRMVITEEEESFNKSKRIISASVTGVMLAYLIEPFVNAFYGGLGSGTLGGVFGGIGVGTVPAADIAGGAAILHGEIIGVIRWVLVLIAVVAIFMIVISGFKAMTNAGSEEGLQELRRTVLYVVGGILLIFLTEFINRTFGITTAGIQEPGNPDIGELIGGIVTIVLFILGFMALVAVAVIVFAGFQMILNFGNEEQFTKARSLIARVAIGLLVIGMSIVLINFVVLAAL